MNDVLRNIDRVQKREIIVRIRFALRGENLEAQIGEGLGGA